MAIRAVWDVTKETFSRWSEDKASDWAAAVAYYTIFSLAPLLLIAIAIAGLLFGAEAARGSIMKEMQGLVGPEGGKAINDLITSANKPAQGIAATVVGLLVLLWGATSLFGCLQDAIHTLWGIQPGPGRGIKGFIFDRLISVGMVLVIGFLLIVSLLFSAAVTAAGRCLGSSLSLTPVLAQIAGIVVSVGLITVLFALMFKFLPAAYLRWRDVWVGAFLTAVLFTVGKTVLGIYLGSGSVASSYGAAASFMLLLLWVDYSAQIFFLGVEFTQVRIRRQGRRIEAAKNATLIDRAKEPEEVPPERKK